VLVRPAWAPLESAAPWRRRLVDALAAWELAILFGLSIGGLYAGWFSPTEAASVGAFSALVLATIRGRLTFKLVRESFASTIRTTCMLFMIVIGAFIFSYFVVQTQLPKLVVDFVHAVQVGPIALIVLLVIFYIIMGCFLDGFGMIVITVPVFLPLIVASGFDPIWFGVIIVIVIELGLIHPPVGMNIFVIQAQAADIPVLRIYAGILPFLIAPMVLIALLIAFPDIALWLPHKLYR
jgi:tripartite ATP-independent transporter DctM subunit